jgi:YegS/Rv2252/BmrU family lipid kinase
MNRQALLLVNRHARQGHRRLSDAIALLNDLGFDLLMEATARPQNFSDTIRRYKDRVTLVIIGGGDGTLNAAIEGLVETQLPLAILPLGTANDLARTLNIPYALPQACQVIAQGKTQAIDLGWVNGKYFFNVASLGLSVNITRNLSKEAKRRWGIFAYGITAFQVLLKSRPFRAEIRVNGESQRVKTVQIAVGNGRHYGGGLTVAADAAIDDQRLDLYSLEIQHWWHMLALLPAMRSGTHASWPFVRALHGQEMEVHTNHRYAINTDGEITTETPAHFRVIPGAIRVMVP